MDKISVIVPVYQAEKYIIRCIESILVQTYQNLEIILVDDGSIDKSGVICDEYAKKDSRIRVIHKKNAGVSAARNQGLDIATGEYITFVDSDDYIDANMYANMIERAKKFQCDVVMCDCEKVEGLSKIPYTHNIRAGLYTEEQLQKEYYPHLLMAENLEYPATISNCLLLFKRKLGSGKDIPRYIEGIRFSEDLLFGAELIYRARSFYYMKGQNFYYYCMNSQSATHQYVPDKWKDYQKLYQKIKELFYYNIEFDFRKQVDFCLLFFLYNAIGDIYGGEELTIKDKVKCINKILCTLEVKKMFKRTKVCFLPVSIKQRILTWCYKYRVGIGILVRYYS